MALAVKLAWAALALYICYCIFNKVLARIQYKRAMRKYGCESPPMYPHKDPILGIDLVRAIKKSMEDGDALSAARERFQKYGKTFRATLMGKGFIFTSDPQNMKTVFALEIDRFGVEEQRQSADGGWLGKGIFMSDGAYWEYCRNLLKPLFARAQISDFSNFEALVEQMVGLIPNDGSVVDLQPLFQRLYLDYSTKFLFGETANALLPGSSARNAEDFIKAFDDGLKGMARRRALGPFVSLQWRDKEWEKAKADTTAVVDRYIDRALERRKGVGDVEKSTPAKGAGFVFLDELVKLTQDRQFLRSQMLNIFFPAKDSSAIGLSCVFFMLARHPDVWDKLRAEVLGVEDKPLTYELLKSMPYLKAVLNECLCNTESLHASIC
jgi:cytochrome P450